MNIIVIDRFYAERRANGLNWKSADRPDDNRKECKENDIVIVWKESYWPGYGFLCMCCANKTNQIVL